MARASDSETNEMLMVRYQRGDRQAFAELVRRFLAPIYEFSALEIGNTDAAVAATTETFLRTLQQAADFKPEWHFASWLFAHARQCCQIASTHVVPLARTGGGNAETTLTGFETSTGSPHELGASVSQAIADMPAELREIWLLKEIGRLSFADIAEITNLPDSEVRARLRHALDRLRLSVSSFEEYTRALRY